MDNVPVLQTLLDSIKDYRKTKHYRSAQYLYDIIESDLKNIYKIIERSDDAPENQTCRCQESDTTETGETYDREE